MELDPVTWGLVRFVLGALIVGYSLVCWWVDRQASKHPGVERLKERVNRRKAA